uniref:Uncharacterized protein n=1 Tax=Oryza nivara TaxID=4536 RepID=A0A0E0HWN8_ORYNI
MWNRKELSKNVAISEEHIAISTYPIPWSIVLPSSRPENQRRRVLAAACIASAASLRAAGERTAANMNKSSTNA